MRVGVGLPSTVPGCDGALLLDWARRAEEGQFSTLAVLDRLVYDSHEPLISLAGAAAVTDRIGLATMVVIGPLRNTALLGKQVASIESLAPNRLTLALALGARLEDYEVAGVPHDGRGRRLSEQLACLRDGFGESPTAPASVSGRPRLLVGGASGQTFARMARYTDGYAHGGGPPRAFAGAAAKARAAWGAFGRSGEPTLWGQAYFALGDHGRGEAYLRDYYAFTGPFAEKIAAGNLTSPRAIRDFIRGYEEEGCEELILLPTVADIAELERLAEVVGQ